MLLQIDDKLGALLQQMAAQAGMGTEAYVSEALLEMLEDREDYATAIAAAKNAAPHISLEELMRKYGLEDQLRQESGKAVRKTVAKRTAANHSLPVRKSRPAGRPTKARKSA